MKDGLGSEHIPQPERAGTREERSMVDGVAEALQKGDGTRVMQLIEDLSLDLHPIQSQESKAALVTAFAECLRKGWLPFVRRFSQDLGLSQEVFRSPEAVRVAQEGARRVYVANQPDLFDDYCKTFDLSQEFVQSVVQQDILELVQLGMAKKLKWIKYPLPKDFFESPQMLAAVRQGVALHLEDPEDAQLKISELTEFLQDLDLSESSARRIVKEVIVISLIKQEGIFRVTNNKINLIRDRFQIPENFFNSDEAHFVALSVLPGLLKQGLVLNPLTDCAPFGVTEQFFTNPEMMAAAKSGFLLRLSNDQYAPAVHDLFKIAQYFGFSDVFLHSAEVQKAAKERVIRWIESKFSHIYNVMPMFVRFCELFGLSEDFFHTPRVQDAARQAIGFGLANGFQDVAKEFSQACFVPDEVVQEIENEKDRYVVISEEETGNDDW